MQFISPLGSPFLRISFFMLALGVLGVLLTAIVAAYPKPATPQQRGLWFSAGLLWFVFWGGLGVTGWFDHWQLPPPMLLLMASVFGAAFSVAGSRVGARLIATFDTRALIASQAFRLPLELLMHRAMTEGLMPKQMSFDGYNLDILAGALALGCALWRAPLPAWLAWTFSAFGTLTLLNILTIAILSLPPIAFFGSAHVNTWIAYFPYVMLPTVFVLAALIGQLVLWRKLLSEPAQPRTAGA